MWQDQTAPIIKAYSFEMIKELELNHPAFTCSKSTTETLEQGVKTASHFLLVQISHCPSGSELMTANK